MISDTIVVFDTPSIKQYVFGTDPLREIRGASALLDSLNRHDTEQELIQALPTDANLDRVYANGGTAQFVVKRCELASVRKACEQVVARYMQQTAGEVQPVFGCAAMQDISGYRHSVARAHFEMRSHRELTTRRHVARLFPLITECASASHLPASGFHAIGTDTPRPLSDASSIKSQRSRVARSQGVWSGWMHHLAAAGIWPDANAFVDLRCDNTDQIGEQSRLKNYVGLVYADGNAMGRVVQQLDSVNTCRLFSEIVDDSIRGACYFALEQICQKEIAETRAAISDQRPLRPLPADILLLGGDDLLVLVPADRALDFGAMISEKFQQLTRDRIAQVENEAERRFFSQHVGEQGFTVSCGVAVARSSYPFYLLLDLAEDLLKNAKRAGAEASHRDRSTTPAAHIDFHVVAGANSYDIRRLREDDYHAQSDAPRTMRPFTPEQINRLRNSVAALRTANFPRSKLHALHEASLAAAPFEAERAIRDIFARCKFSKESGERQALWRAIYDMLPAGSTFNFPWFEKDDDRMLVVADVIEAAELFVTSEDFASLARNEGQ